MAESMAEIIEEYKSGGYWDYFPFIPVGSIFSFGGPTKYRKTSDATFREFCSYDRSQRVFAKKDLGKLLMVIKRIDRQGDNGR